MTNGIYTVANDVVYDQLVALLNSIEVNAGNYPVCVIAYDDDRLDRVRAEIATRPNVTLLEDPALFARWETFSERVWKAHPTALNTWQAEGIPGVYRLGMNRRYCAFDPNSPFEKFVYLDADTLVLNSLAVIFEQLDQSDFVVYDFQHKDPSHIYNLESPKLLNIFDQARIGCEIFCAGMYASKQGVFSPEERDWLVAQLEAGDAEVLRMASPNQSVLNYMVMKSRKSVCNLAFHLPETQVTGNSVTSTHFEAQDQVLYDHGKRLTYLHYIGLSSKLFTQVCAGVNVGFPYRDVFLHYRYLHEPEKRPVFTTKPKPYNQPPGFTTRVLRKLGFVH